jgi:hypothetical protein
MRVFGAGASGHVGAVDTAVFVVVSMVVGRDVESAAVDPVGELPLVADFALLPPHPEPAISTSSTAILRNEGCLSFIANMMHRGELSRYWPEGEETLASSCFRVAGIR